MKQFRTGEAKTGFLWLHHRKWTQTITSTVKNQQARFQQFGLRANFAGVHWRTDIPMD